jgi:hypothetical protein
VLKMPIARPVIFFDTALDSRDTTLACRRFGLPH